MDTVRADHLGYQGYERDTSPRIDALAEKSMRFSWAFAQGLKPESRWHLCLLESTIQKLTVALGTGPAFNSNVTLAERLSNAGYHAGIPRTAFLPSYGLHQDSRLGLSVEKHQKKVALGSREEVTDRAIEYLGERDPDGRPLFFWLHYFDPHFAYKAHDAYPFGDSDLDRYDAEIRYTDAQIGRLLDWLQDSPLQGKTYVIIHSDHGEGFGLHGYRYHGQHLYNDQVHVPLIVSGPGYAPFKLTRL